MSNAPAPAARAAAGDARLEELLFLTSRTFALCIPALPQPLRREVTVAYLLLRIADTFEDMTAWPPARRIAALESFRAAIESGDPFRLREDFPAAHDGDRQLLAEAPLVFHALDALSGDSGAIVRAHVARSVAGMMEVLRSPGELRDVGELRRYCYFVAGIVGEMLTELFLRAMPRAGTAARALRARAATFGEALQLVNILKDAEVDAAEGRFYLPRAVPLATVFAIARADLEIAAEYTRLLQDAGAPQGVVEFTSIPLALARSALDVVQTRGPGAKVSRAEVAAIVRRVQGAVPY